MNKSATVQFSQTYLYKLHSLTNALDKAFDKVLQAHANLTLPQFMLLITVSENGPINQRKAAQLLGISPAAVKRQTDIAIDYGRLELALADRSPGQNLQLTARGRADIKKGLRSLEIHLFQVFSDNHRSVDLMTHLNLLLGHTKGVLNKQAASVTPIGKDRI